jgi:hypothetical protein
VGRDEPLRDWEGLRAAHQAGVAVPPAIHRDEHPELPVVVTGWVDAEVLRPGRIPAAAQAAAVDAYDRLARTAPPAHWWLPALAGPEETLARGRFAVRTDRRCATLPGVDWLAGPEAERAGTTTEPCLGRGLTDPDRHLWDGDRLWLVDFAESGVSDARFQEALLVEAWQLPDPPPALLAARRLIALDALFSAVLAGVDPASHRHRVQTLFS